jgi:hypothetical protein
MRLFLLAFVFFTGGFFASAQANAPLTKKDTAKPQAFCLKEDKLDWWEGTYIQAQSGADDWEAEVFKTFKLKFDKDQSVPTERCKRIVWLKEKTCGHWKSLKANELRDCLQSKDFPETVHSNYEYYHGG